VRVQELRDKLEALIAKGYSHAVTNIATVDLYESEDPRTWPDEVHLVRCEEVTT